MVEAIKTQIKRVDEGFSFQFPELDQCVDGYMYGFSASY